VFSKGLLAKLCQVFPGGVKQTVPPFIPRSIGTDLNSFLTRA